MSLDVHLHGERIGSLEPGAEGNGPSFAYTPELVENHDPERPLLSCSLPVRAEPYGPEEIGPYLEGLLPQGERRERIAAELGVDPDDAYALIAALGRDCPGAVLFLAEGEEPTQPAPDSIAWLSEGELEQLLCPEPERLLDPDVPQRMRFTLSGARHKIALHRDGRHQRWAWPEPGLPSTHILKPEPADRPGLLVNEMACTTAYREMGLPAAHTALAAIAGRPCLVSKRFDRWGEGNEAERLHQESLSQALGVAPNGEQGSGARETPSLAQSCTLLQQIGEKESPRTMMRAAFCNLLIGNCDEHGPNSALLHTEQGPLPAPFYDIASTELYGDLAPEHFVIAFNLPPADLLIEIARISTECGLEFQPSLIEAIKTMTSLGSALNDIAAQAQEEGWYSRVIDEALQLLTGRAIGFGEEMEFLRPPGGEPLL